MSQEEVKTAKQQTQACEAAMQIKTMSQQIQADIKTVTAMVEKEKERRIARINQEEKELEAQLAELKQQFTDVLYKEQDIREQICKKYGHKYQISTLRFIEETQEVEVTYVCICCSKTNVTILSYCPNDDIKNLPPEMEEALKDALKQVLPKIEELKEKIKVTREKLANFPNQYLQEICIPFGHSPRFPYIYAHVFPNVECKLCKKMVNIWKHNLLEDIERWANLNP